MFITTNTFFRTFGNEELPAQAVTPINSASGLYFVRI